uniref:Uncharacterized protein n=1 Tax=Rhipicephalus zambeziensis TaxID=60191 RepID=A0A224YEU7_9ACAR
MTIPVFLFWLRHINPTIAIKSFLIKLESYDFPTQGTTARKKKKELQCLSNGCVCAALDQLRGGPSPSLQNGKGAGPPQAPP